MKRRRAIDLMLGGVAGLAAGCAPDRESRMWTWRGVLFQSPVEVRVAEGPGLNGERLAERIVAAIRRAEQSFSLFEPDSEIRRLNREGRLESPSEEFLTVLRWALALAERSDGVFDPTIQARWRFLWENGGRKPSAAELGSLAALVDYRKVEAGRRRVRFSRPGMELTLNSVAQGFAADRVAGSLREAGVTRALVNMGEFMAIGGRSPRRPWMVKIRAGGAGGPIVAETELADQALAVSSGAGLRLGAGTGNHLLHPLGEDVPADRVVTVKAPLALTADGLSTACALMAPPSAQALVASFPPASLRVWDGSAGATTASRTGRPDPPWAMGALVGR